MTQYLSLARRYRPQNFKEVVGQSSTLQSLQNALNQQKCHDCYLFTGTRGVGKTTIARLLAKSLNCEQGVSASPCGVCGSCLEATAGTLIDFIEVDAASKTKIEDMRELIEQIHYLPTKGRFKVFLIDEVHMLSNHSFNALLKTLEEPPSHVKFILATTDPQKIPMTILSRTLQYNLTPLSVSEIDAHLASVLKKENIDCSPEATLILAQAAAGSLRDALSMTDQALAFSNFERVEADTVRQMLGIDSTLSVSELLMAILSQDNALAFSRFRHLVAQAPHMSWLHQTLLSLLQALITKHHLPNETTDFTDESLQPLLKLQTPLETLHLAYEICLVGRNQLAFAPDALQASEMTLLRLLSMMPISMGIALRSVATAPASVQPTPVQPTPVQPTPVQPTPVQPTPVQPTPVQPTPVQPTPVQPTPVQPTPVQPTPVQPTPVQSTPSTDSLADTNPNDRLNQWLSNLKLRDAHRFLSAALKESSFSPRADTSKPLILKIPHHHMLLEPCSKAVIRLLKRTFAAWNPSNLQLDFTQDALTETYEQYKVIEKVAEDARMLEQTLEDPRVQYLEETLDATLIDS